MYQPSSYILRSLESLGIDVNWGTLRKYKFQGFMSEVFEIDSSQGKLMIHKTYFEQSEPGLVLYEKYKILGKYFSSLDNPLFPEYIIGEFIDGSMIFFQVKIDGIPVGKRILSGMKISDEFLLLDIGVFIRSLLSELGKLHQRKFLGGGLPRLIKDTMDGQLSSWKKYLEKEYLIWLNLCGCDSLIKSKIEEIIYSLPADITSVLIHGDAINPGNILIREGNIVGIVDWEWSIIGDPAWEFADTGWEKIIGLYGLESYFEFQNYSLSGKKNFLERIEKYRILWGASVHAKDKDPILFDILIRELTDRITYTSLSYS